MKTYTADDILALRPCYSEGEIRRLVVGGVTAREIADASHVDWADRIWVLVRLMPLTARPRFAADVAESVLHLTREQDRDICRAAIAEARREPPDASAAADAADAAADAADDAAASAASAASASSSAAYAARAARAADAADAADAAAYADAAADAAARAADAAAARAADAAYASRIYTLQIALRYVP